MADPEPIHLNFVYEAEDFPSFARLTSRSDRAPGQQKATSKWSAYRSLLGWAAVISFFVLIFVVFGKPYHPPEPQPPGPEVRYETPPWLFWLTFFLGCITIASIGMVFRWMRAWRMKWCKAVSGCTNAVEISSDGVRWETETHSSLYRWAYFGGFDDLPTAFHILTQGRGMVFILPKRVMTPEQIDAARGYFQGRIVAPAPAGPGGGASGAGG